jgi:hypothetical protein
VAPYACDLTLDKHSYFVPMSDLEAGAAVVAREAYMLRPNVPVVDIRTTTAICASA